MNRSKIKILFVLLIATVVFIAVTFLIPFPKGSVFWLAFFAEIIAIGLQIPFFKVAFENSQELNSKILGFPIFRVGYIYLAIQTILSIILFILGAILEFPLWAAAVICLLVLAVAIICGISTDIARENIVNIENVQNSDTQFMQSLRTRSEYLSGRTTDIELKEKLDSLAEKIKLSDPISSPQIAEKESQLEREFVILCESISNTSTAMAQCQVVVQCLEERNIACRNNKHN